jgi:putative membrane protein
MSEGRGSDEKTDLAEDRTILANERTFAGWLRTGFASIGVGVGFGALFRTMEPEWLAKAIATAFLLLGIFIVSAAERRAAAVATKVNPHFVKTARPMNLRVITIVTGLATGTLVCAIWLVRIR